MILEGPQSQKPQNPSVFDGFWRPSGDTLWSQNVFGSSQRPKTSKNLVFLKSYAGSREGNPAGNCDAHLRYSRRLLCTIILHTIPIGFVSRVASLSHW